MPMTSILLLLLGAAIQVPAIFLRANDWRPANCIVLGFNLGCLMGLYAGVAGN